MQWKTTLKAVCSRLKLCLIALGKIVDHKTTKKRKCSQAHLHDMMVDTSWSTFH